MIHYIPAQKEIEHELLDFANYVFSHDHRPHDFKALIPKVYGSSDFFRFHFVARGDQGIRALIGMLPVTLKMADGESLSCGYIGTVSVHPYARGEGHMKHLMKMAREDAIAQGMDFMMLGGQRQRYQYFGFERAGTDLRFTLTYDNIRHALKALDASKIQILPMKDASAAQVDQAFALYEKEEMVGVRSRETFTKVLSSWNHTPYIVLSEGDFCGYFSANGSSVNEWVLPEESMLRVLKAWQKTTQNQSIDLAVKAHKRKAVALLSSLCEGYALADAAMVHVLNWIKVLGASLRFKAKHHALQDGTAVLDVQGTGRFRLSIQGGKVEVTETHEEATLSLDENQAVNLLFSPICQNAPGSEHFCNWLPLALEVPSPDAF